MSKCDLSESKAVMANGLCITGAACITVKEECDRLRAAEGSDLRRLHPVATIVPQVTCWQKSRFDLFLSPTMKTPDYELDVSKYEGTYNPPIHTENENTVVNEVNGQRKRDKYPLGNRTDSLAE